MIRPTRSSVFIALLGTVLLVGSCVGDGPTDLGENALVGLRIQPALIPSPADASALPIQRIRTGITSHPGGAVLRESSFDVSPSAASWSIDVLAPASQQPTDVVLYLYLIHVANDGTESVQFSGRTLPFSVTAGTTLTNLNVDIVRGPLSNLSVTGVSVSSFPDTLALGSSVGLSATATTSASTPPDIFWTSLDPTVVTMADSVATGLSAGTANVVASAGAHADTVSIVVISPPVDSVRVLPDSADVVAGLTRAYTVELRDANGNVLSGRSIFWQTTNTSVATVTQAGVVNAVSPGTTRVRATSEGVFDEAVVRVVAVQVPVRSVLVSPDSAVVQAGNTTTFTAQTLDSIGGVLTGRLVTWTTGSSSVATVNTSGVVTAVAPGTTTVRATSEGVFDEATVRVVAAPAGGVTIQWIQGTNGNWSDPTAWDLGRIPQAGDTVRIEQGNGYLVTLDVNATIARLVIGGTTSTIYLGVGDQTLTITGTGAGDELDIHPIGAIEIDNGTVRVADVRNDGAIYSFSPSATLEAATILNNGDITVVSDAGLTVSHPTALDFRTSGAVTVESGGALLLGTNTVFTYEGGSITDTGVLFFQGGSEFVLEADLTIDGTGIFLQDSDITTASAARLTLGPQSLMQVTSSGGPAQIEPKLVVEGNVHLSGPNITLSDSVRVDPTGVILVDGSAGTTQVTTGGFENSGTLNLLGAATFGPRSAAGMSITNRAGANIFLATTIGQPVLNGELINEGTLTVAADAVLRRTDASGTTHVAAQHLNTGLIEQIGGADLTIELGGSSPTITNSGTIAVGAGSTNSVVNLSNGQVIATATAVLEGSGTVDLRTGTPTGINDGTLAPGISAGGIGALTWLGSVPMGSTGRIALELDGTTPGTGHDQLNVSGTLFLNGLGTLDVSSPTFVPADGDRFAVMTFGARAGNFAGVTLPNISGMTFDTLWAEAGTVDTLFVVASGQGPQTLTWTGAIDTDWSKAGNWSPAQVPRAFDGVSIPAGPINQPTLTGSSVAGGVTIAGLGARLTIGGQTLTTGSLTTHTDGLLVMTNPADFVDVTGSGAFFQGGNETGLLTAGVLRVAGDFTQQQQTTSASFRASGTHRTVLTGSTLQSVRFCCGTGAPSGFQDLDISNSAGINIQFSGFGAFVYGTLTSLVGTGPAPRIYMLGTPMTVGRFQVDKLIVDRGTLTLNEGGVAQAQQFDNVTFVNYQNTQTQFAIVAPGGAGAPRTLTFNNLQFQPLTTGNTGRYLTVTAPSGTLILNLPGAAAVVGNGPTFTTISGAVTVNWQ